MNNNPLFNDLFKSLIIDDEDFKKISNLEFKDVFEMFFPSETEIKKPRYVNSEGLELVPAYLSEEYREEFNIVENHDYLVLMKNDKPINSILYRIGGMGTMNITNLNYFLLLKCYEEIGKNSRGKRYKYLKSDWVILDKFGYEKIHFKNSNSPYLIKNSGIYTMDRSYYFIEGNELILDRASSSIETENYLLLENRYDRNKDLRGCWKIDKKTNQIEILK